MPEGVIQALVLWAGLLLALPALSPARCGARLFGIALLEFYTLRYITWRALHTLPVLALAPRSLWPWAFFLVESLSTVYICCSSLALIRRSDHSDLATARERSLKSRPIKPAVAVLIPTVNEVREVLGPTLRAAAAIDYPSLEVIVLDDDKGPKAQSTGNPKERVHAWLPALCQECGVRYLRRTSSVDAKVGNLNFGISNTQADVILVLDADFRAEANILWRTVGLLDDRVALVQTPQHYYSSDPIQDNLGGETAWTEEQRHFFDVVLPARDAWGNALCVGTGFVVRRDALGPDGFVTGCLSEDVYSGYELLSRGYEIRYLNECLSHGAAADTLPEYIRQRVRWCQGIVQALWLPHGPLRAAGLRLLDRLFYIEMPLYWVSEFGFLACVLIAPLLYLWAGLTVFTCSLDDALSYVLPRLVAVSMVSYWMSKGRVMPVITEIKKLVGVVYILGAIFSLVVEPHGKPFVPTLKNEPCDRIRVHMDILLPFLIIGLLIGGGLLWNLGTDAGPVRWDEFLPVNVALALYMMAMLFFCCLACIDLPKGPRRVNYNQTLEGRWLRSLWALVRLLFSPTSPASGVHLRKKLAPATYSKQARSAAAKAGGSVRP
jgi:cellulose synthase (UDP-forming)